MKEGTLSRKQHLLPVSVRWSLSFCGLPLCTNWKAGFAECCSHAERGEQEGLGSTAGLYLLLWWLWFNHGRARSTLAHCKSQRNVLHLLAIANGTSSQRCIFHRKRIHQPLNVGNSTGTLYFTNPPLQPLWSFFLCASSQGCRQRCTARSGVKLGQISGRFFSLPSALCVKSPLVGMGKKRQQLWIS